MSEPHPTQPQRPKTPSETLTVTKMESGQRLDNYLIKHLKGVPRTHIYRIVRDGQVREVPPRRDLVERLVEPSVGAREHVLRVVGVDPERVVVRVLFATRAQVVERLATVASDLVEDVHLDDERRIGWRRLDFLVVVRPGAS